LSQSQASLLTEPGYFSIETGARRGSDSPLARFSMLRWLGDGLAADLAGLVDWPRHATLFKHCFGPFHLKLLILQMTQ
jgi:hypothetical protein